MISPWVGIGLTLATLLALLALVHNTSRQDPELARKTVHVGMGLVTLSFPWLFDTSWPVVALAGFAALFFLALRLHAPLRRTLGGALHDVARPSCGEFHFVAGTCVVFVLSDGDVLRFGVSMLVLTFADTAAALVGRRYAGPLRAGRKSMAGSLAFLIVAFPCAFVPLVFIEGADGAECVATAAFVALVATALEALGRRGLDNLLVPVGVCAAFAFARDAAPATTGPNTATLLAIFAAASLLVLVAFMLVLSVPRAPAARTWAAK